MRIVVFLNNRLGLESLRFLKDQNACIAALVLHPPARRRFGAEILQTAQLPEDRIFDASQLERPETLGRLAALRPELGVSVLFGYILRNPLLDIFTQGVVNLHPAFLPFNRGAYPNVWSIIDGTPAGVTLHWVDAGVDTGDIVAQKEVAVRPTDTGKTLYERLEEAGIILLREIWPALASGNIPRRVQSREDGTSHRLKDVDAIDQIHLDRSYVARDLINILRARTCPPYPGAYFLHNGEKIFVRVQLMTENELEK